MSPSGGADQAAPYHHQSLRSLRPQEAAISPSPPIGVTPGVTRIRLRWPGAWLELIPQMGAVMPSRALLDANVVCSRSASRAILSRRRPDSDPTCRRDQRSPGAARTDGEGPVRSGCFSAPSVTYALPPQSTRPGHSWRDRAWSNRSRKRRRRPSNHRPCPPRSQPLWTRLRAAAA